MLYIVLAKAYDTDSHVKLLYKNRLLNIGGSALEWFEEFLYNRIQHVRIDSKLSMSHFVRSGIPHGAVLVTLFFLLYINDFSYTQMILGYKIL